MHSGGVGQRHAPKIGQRPSADLTRLISRNAEEPQHILSHLVGCQSVVAIGLVPKQIPKTEKRAGHREGEFGVVDVSAARAHARLGAARNLATVELDRSVHRWLIHRTGDLDRLGHREFRDATQIAVELIDRRAADRAIL